MALKGIETVYVLSEIRINGILKGFEGDRNSVYINRNVVLTVFY